MTSATAPTVGLLGGMSWHSTAHYYRLINETVAAQRGGHASARMVVASLDFAEVRARQTSGDWVGAAAQLSEAAAGLERAGATCVAIATNLMHKVAPAVAASISVPLVHIADAVAAAALASNPPIKTLAVVGTGLTMTEPFYSERLAQHGLGTVVPEAEARGEIDRIIFEELTQGVMGHRSRDFLAAEFGSLVAAGADAIVLACTELMLLVDSSDSAVPLIDSCAAHADALAQICLEEASAEGFVPSKLQR